MQQLSDLVEAACCMSMAREHRHSAFGQLIDLFQDALYARAVHMVSDPQLAQDIVQETLLTAYQQLPQLREPQAFPIWLNQILRTHSNRLHRKRKISTVFMSAIAEDEAIDSEMNDPAVVLAAADMRHTVLAAIADLPEHERLIVQLFYLQGFSLKEIADWLKLPLTTIKKRLQYARDRLRSRMADEIESILSRCQTLVALVLAGMLPARTPGPVLIFVPTKDWMSSDYHHERHR